MDSVKIIKMFDVDSVSESIKPWAEAFIRSGESFPAILQLWSYDQQIATIVLPPTQPGEFEPTWSRVVFAGSLLNATHVVFAHRAEIAVSSNMTLEELNSISSACLCVYITSVVSVHGAIYSYTYSPENDVILWSPVDQENTDMLQKHDFLKTFLAMASADNARAVDPYIYIEWLRANGYSVEFHEPFNDQNFGYLSAE